MAWRFLKHFGLNKASNLLDDFTGAVVAFDPETASRSQLAMMEEELDRLGYRLAEAEEEVRRERQETREIETKYEKYLSAAGSLEEQVLNETNPDERERLEMSLSRIITRLEELKPEIEREKQEDQDVEAWSRELRTSFEDLAGKLKTAHRDLKSAQRQMELAQLQRDRAREANRRAKEAAGMVNSMSAMSVALDKMNQQTARARAEADTLNLKAGLFRADQLEDDPNIAKALSHAERGAGPPSSLSDRLAALKGVDEPKRLKAV